MGVSHSVLDHEDDIVLIVGLKELGRQDDVLAGELPFHQGCLHHETDQDGGMDGKCGEVHFQNHG